MVEHLFGMQKVQDSVLKELVGGDGNDPETTES